MRLIPYFLALSVQFIQVIHGEARKMTIANNCSYTIWPAASGWSALPTNLSLQTQQSVSVDLGVDQLVWVWGRTNCRTSTGKFSCQTGDCRSGKMDCSGHHFPNATTMVQLMLANKDDEDAYGVSLENGYNVPISVDPSRGSGSGCRVTGCVFNVSGACPSVLRLGGACRDPCDVFGTSQYCCPQAKCGPTTYSLLFKQYCPRASSYPMDDTSSFACGGSPPYTITFCPSSTAILRELSEPYQQSPSPSPSPSQSELQPPSQSPQPRKSNGTRKTHAEPPYFAFRKTKRRKSPTSVLIVVPTLAAVLILLMMCIWMYITQKKAKKKCHGDIDEMKTMESLQFDINAIRAATNDFSVDNKLGEGGFGEVYKGILENGQKVAVKRLLQSSKQGEIEFKTEVVLVARLQHKNLVKLLGFCVTPKEKILVYELLSNSSLDRFLFDMTRSASLDWQTRFNIIVGVARGLVYLHEDSRFTIIHRDLKASNILLDEAMNPKISDFGLAKLFGEDQTQGDTNRIVGTYGYMAPEYAMTGHYSVKSDVYSFGIIVIEIISGEKNRFFRQELEEPVLYRAWRLWNEQNPLELVDTRLSNDFSMEEAIRCIHIGLLCIQENAAQRPKMRLIFDALCRPSIGLPEPRPPRFFDGTTNTEDQSGTSNNIYTGGQTITDISDIYPRS